MKPSLQPTPLLIQIAIASALLVGLPAPWAQATSNTCATPPPNLVGWWRAENATLDSVGGNLGIPHGGISYASGMVGQAFKFDGATGFLEVPSSPELKPTTALSVEAWIFMDHFPPQAANSIITKGQDAEVAVDWNLSVQVPKKLRPHVNAGGVWGYFDCATVLATGVWYHVAMVYDGATLKGYVNGALDGSVPFSGAIQATDHPLRIGAYAPVNGTGSKHFFNGLIDEPSVYNRALGSNEIAEIYIAGAAGKCSTNLPPSSFPPVITDFAPRATATGTELTLTGMRFSPIPTSNVVLFGAVRAQVTAATPSQLTVVVPPGATYAPITVSVDGLVAYAPAPFQPTFTGDGSHITSSAFEPRFDLGAGDGAHRSAIADLDGDGRPDLAIADVYGHTISLFRNISTAGVLGLGSFEPRVVLPAEGGSEDNPYGFVTADVDGDGKLDLVACDRLGNNISVYRNIASPGSLTTASFAPHINFPVGADPRYARVADLDGDGRPDIVSCNYAADTLSILRNIGMSGSLDAGAFAPHVELPAGDGPYDVAIGDLDGDGKPDLAVANNDTLSVSLYHNLSSPGTLDGSSFAPRVDLFGGQGNDTIALGDLDGDNRADLVVGSYISESISVYRNQASPGALTTNSFAPRAIFITAHWTHTVALSDLNGDQRADIVTVGELDSYAALFENLSTPGDLDTGSFGSRVVLGAGWNAWGVSAGDLDLDGPPDIVFCNAYDDTVSVYRNVSPMTNPPPPVCPPDTVAWWKADDNTLDQLGAHDGETPFGIAYADGVVGKAFDFDGSQRRVSVPDSPEFKLTNAMTLEAWVYPRAYQGFITFRGDNRGGLDTWTLDAYEPGFMKFSIIDDTNGVERVMAPLTLNQWQHVAATWDRASGSMQLYTNGMLAAETNTTLIPIADLDAEGAVGIGNHGGTFHQFPFNGLIDELAIYSRALTASEIAAIHSAGSAGKCPPDTISTNLIVNGGFELPIVAGSWVVIPAGGTLPGWVVATGSVDVVAEPYWEAPEGIQSLDLNGNGPGAIYQDIPTLPGQVYRIGFSYAGNFAGPPPLKTASVTWDGQILTNLTFDATGRSPSDMGWIHVECLATAVSSSSRLGFHSTMTLLNGVALDDVTVRATTGSQPQLPPTITTQPQDLTVPAGTTAVFNVVAAGSQPLTYQWFKEDDAITNATQSSLSLNNVQPDQAGSYFVVVSNAVGSVTSSNAVLTVQTFPPMITQQPVDQVVHEGRSAMFSVTATGTEPLIYQWFFGDQELTGQTGRILTLGNVITNQAGSYFVTVSNAYGSAQSSNAILTILPPPVCVPAPEGAVAWWPGESNTWDVVGGFDGFFYQAPSFAPLYATGIVGTAFKFQPSWAIAVPQAPELNLGIGDGFTFETWVNPDSVSGTYGIFGWGGSAPGVPSTPVGVNLRIVSPGVLQAQLIKTNGQPVLLQSAPSLLQARLWQHVALSCDTTNGDVAILLNGVLVARTNLGPTALRTTGVLRLGNAAGPQLYGLLDEPTLYTRALSHTEIQSVYLADDAGKCQPPPPPCLETPGIVALWRGESNTVDIAAGNNGIMIPTNYPPQLGYQTGQNGAAFSFDGPNYLSVPRSESLDVGKTEGLTIEGWVYPQNYTGVPIVEWTDSNAFGVYLAIGYTGPGSLEANLIDVTNGFHRIQAPYAIGGTYWAHVALTYDKASGQAALYLNGSAVAATNLGTFTPRTDMELLVGFHPRYTGTPVFGSPPTTDRRFTGAMDELGIYRRALNALEIRALARAGAHRCLEFPPTIGRQPMDQIALEGGTARLEVGAGGTEPLQFQWYFGTIGIPEATNRVLSVAGVTLADAGGYSVVISNAFGSTTSRVATVSVLPANQCLPPSDAAVAWWKGESNEWDVFEVSDAFWALNTPPGFTSGLVGAAFRLGGTSYLQVPANAQLDVSRGSGFSVEGWIKPDFAFQSQSIVDWNDTRQNVGVGIMLSRTAPGVVEVTLTDTNAISSADRMVTFTSPPYSIGSQNNPFPGWTHVALTFDRPSGRARLFVNGRQVADRVIAPIRTYTPPRVPVPVPFTPATSGNFYLGYRPSGLYSGPRFRGGLDEFTVYDRSLSEAEVQSIYIVGSNGKCAPPPPACLAPIPEIVGWWRGESNTLDSVQDNHLEIYPPSKPVTLSYSPGRIGTAFRFLGSDHLQADASPSLDVGTGPGLTLEAWINPSQFRPQPIFEWNTGTGAMGVNLSYSSTGGTGTMEVNLVDTNGGFHQLFTPLNTVSYNTWLHVAATYDKARGMAAIYYNGQLITNRVVGSFTPRTSSNLYFGYRPPGAYPGSGTRFIGSMDEMTIYGRALTADEIRTAYRSRIGKCTEPPVIVEHPVSQRVNAGTPVVMAGVVTGNPILRYQWTKDGIPVSGLAGPALEFLSAEEPHQGIYAFTVSNNFGWALSSNALLLVNYPPVADASLTLPLIISPNNLDATVVLDGSLTSDPDNDPLSYQWFSSLNSQPSILVATDAVSVVTLPVGSHAIELVADDGMLSDTNAITVDVITPAQAVESLVEAVENADLQHRQDLIAILSAALAAIDRSNPTAAINQLQAFQNQVLAQLAPLDSALAAQFIQQAQEIIDVLQGGGIDGPGHGHVAAKISNGKVSLDFDGTASRIYLIEASGDMVHWQRIGVARHRGNGRFEFQDALPPTRPCRYYRVVVP